ncbi:MAG: DUF3318 domain-containing protein [Limnospira sp. PMC 1291.21]|uniref:DUF3318 domain-containing protein n=2 Tax=Limnospira TaxID=2596745 RepID=A0A9P1KCT1_9CYAN|nr:MULTISPECIES: DUF3318 domain-containing protein [Limnospira]EKD11073.1 hypothetical protein SPLC1_S040700 [Arthrospira platensis C1]MDT9184737.1 DUF3318 domain-containing protein [Limnospira sp. PMC 289.06]MDY7054889.1 DUF3318 domain-containing protein [Limnospira fusiformis LS22]QJB27756.1 DUF3318 domain-containing protein [Limnospira fusiformis SAG 85.79]MDT9177757.1 DUF3318 domain-containing protein [Limnospira sp. PMC 1238.20]
MNPDTEIRHLLDLMPASGRMMARLIANPRQSTVIQCEFPLPWKTTRPILINFDLWKQLSRPQRDLLLLRTVSWVTNVQWFKPDWNQGIVVAGIVGVGVQFMQQDAVGVLLAGGLAAIGVRRVWQANQRSEMELEADDIAIRVAARRGYEEAIAAAALAEAIEVVATIEGRRGLSFMELVRCQHLKAIANSYKGHN